MNWNWDYAWDILPKLLSALPTVFAAMLGGFAFASVLGLILALLSRSSFTPVRFLTRAFVEFIRNTPLLVQLFFLYFSVSMLLPSAPSALTTGIFGLGLHYSTYLSEVYRSGIEAVPKGQWEAAKALNFSRWRTWSTIVLPQALPPIVPVMGNYLIVIFKEVPLLSAITLVELVLTAKNIVSIYYRPFEPFTMVGVIYLFISACMSMGVRWLEARMARDEKRASVVKAVQAKKEKEVVTQYGGTGLWK